MAFGFELIGTQQYPGRAIPEEQRRIIASILAGLRNEGSGQTAKDLAVQAGLCMGWSAEWIHHHATGSDFWLWLQSQDAKGDLVRMAHQEHQTSLLAEMELRSLFQTPDPTKRKEQQDLLARVREERTTWARDWIVGKGVLKASPRYTPDSSTNNAATLARKIGQGEGFKLVVLVLAKQHGNHAVATSVSGSTVVYVDPNGGEAEFDRYADFEKWFLNAHLPFYQAAGFNDYYFDSFPTPVNATVSVQDTLHATPPRPVRAARKVDLGKRGVVKLAAADVQQALADQPADDAPTQTTTATSTRPTPGRRAQRPVGIRLQGPIDPTVTES
jgi:hypothetical protein